MNNFKQQISSLKAMTVNAGDKKIYLGTKRFDLVMKALGILYGCNEIRLPAVTLVRDPYAPANVMYTEDAELGGILEMMDKELNGNEKSQAVTSIGTGPRNPRGDYWP